MTQAAETRLSKSALFSLIFAILFCIPGSGLLAMLLGLIGVFAAGKPGMRGRWMAIVGGILGFFTTILQVVFLFVFGGLALFGLAVGMVKEPMNVADNFVQQVAAGDYASVEAQNPGWDKADLEDFHDAFAAEGTFVKTEFSEFKFTDSNNTTAHLGGTATFSKGSRAIEAELEKDDKGWHVKEFTIHKK